MSDFRSAATRLSAHMALDGLEPEIGDYESVRGGLLNFLLARFRVLGVDELLDIVDESLTRLLRESRRQGRALDHASAWLVTVARNQANDLLRRGDDGWSELPDLPDDDAIARFIDREATAQALHAALERAITRGDHLVVRVVTEGLDFAELTGRTPSSRELGERCGYSHTTVNQAIARFRADLRAVL